MTEISVLDVLLNDVSIGSLTSFSGDRSLFTFHESYTENPDRDILSLSFKRAFNQVAADERTYQTQVHPFFSNLLPEGSLRGYIAQKAGIKPVREFQLLSILGNDLSGSVKLIPLEILNPLQILDEVDKVSEQDAEQQLRFSLAGVQLKFSAMMNKGKSKGLTIPAHGVGGDWIVKLPSSRFQHVPENEFSMMRIASKIGINVPEIDLVSLDQIENIPNAIEKISGNAFIIKRFDRKNGKRIHIEDFAQVFSVFPENKYEKASYAHIARVLSQETNIEHVKEFIRRMVFSTLIGNDDMHLKNWSLIYHDPKEPELSPAYDLLSTIPYTPSQDMALKYRKTKKMPELTLNEIVAIADFAMVPSKMLVDVTKDTVEQFMSVWNEEKQHLPMQKEVAKAVDDHLDILKII